MNVCARDIYIVFAAPGDVALKLSDLPDGAERPFSGAFAIPEASTI